MGSTDVSTFKALLGEGLSTFLKLKPGESALEKDSGVPTELRDPVGMKINTTEHIF